MAAAKHPRQPPESPAARKGTSGELTLRQLGILLAILLKEALVPGSLERKPEDFLVMDASDQVDAWHEQGADDGPIAPIYHLNALACSRLAPHGGIVVDLGCGSGRYAAYLARQRPDLKIVGYDLSLPMIELGNAALRASGLAERVELRLGDMTAFARQIPNETVLINCLFAIHHLPSLSHVRQCFEQMKHARAQTGCSFWVFDLVRPRHRSTADAYPEAFTPNAPNAFRLDSINSLIAAYTYSELLTNAQAVFGGLGLQSRCSRLLRLYQAFWCVGENARGHQNTERSTFPGHTLNPLSNGTRQQYRGLRLILPGLPC